MTDRFTTALDKAVNLKYSFLTKLKDSCDVRMQDRSSHKPKKVGIQVLSKRTEFGHTIMLRLLTALDFRVMAA